VYPRWSLGGMIPLENVPKSGVMIVTVNFKDYKDSHANDCRRILGGDKKRPERWPGLVATAAQRGLTVKITPLNYALSRTISNGIKRGTGGVYFFGYSGMTPDDLRGINQILAEMAERNQGWWEQAPDLKIADWVEGL
jgi:hypothetical protein